MPAGRPTIYTDELGERICSLIAEGISVREICAADDMPCQKSIYRWLVSPDHEQFRQKYTEARQAQAERLAEEILEIADNGTNDYVERLVKDGAVVLADHDHIQRSKLRVDTRKWLLSKLQPKKYGEKVELSGSVEIVGVDTGIRRKD